MVDLGADVKATDDDGNTPYDIAEDEREEEVAEYLKEQNIALINKKDTFSEDESKYIVIQKYYV